MIMKNEEIWKTYPEFPWVEGSNLGRVRTIDRYINGKNGLHPVKGRVLKQHRDKDGYMRVRVSVNGGRVNRFVHRVIASCFIKNPNNFEQINHKNCIRDDNRVENLEWCTHEYNTTYREKYGIACSRPVFAVNLKTQEVLWFKSQMEASRQLGVYQRDINNVINGRVNHTHGYWFTKYKHEITKEKLQKIKANMQYRGDIFVINLETQEVLQFGSQSEAACQLAIGITSINNVLRGYQNQTKGYWFVYADENAINKTRAKFDDEVVDKVKKLMEEN